MRFFIASGYGYWGDFTPDDLNSEDRQIGGGETAMISISRELANLGHEVIVFHDTRPGRYDGVDYLPTGLFVPMVGMMEHDVMVSWDNPYLFRFRIMSRMNILAFQLNDADVGIFDWVIDKYFHPSQWHINMFEELYGEQMDTKKSVPRITNGVDFSRYVLNTNGDRGHRVVYSSSPDRGLHHLLRIWPRIREEVEDAELHVFYDMGKWMKAIDELDAEGVTTITSERAHVLREQMQNGLPGVRFHGGVGQKRLAEEQQRSAVLAYPCDPVRPTEGFSMTILEGIAAGCDVVVSDADALPELWADAPGVTMLPLPIDDGAWTEVIVNKLKKSNGDRPDLNARTDLSWSYIARRWEEEIEGWLT